MGFVKRRYKKSVIRQYNSNIVFTLWDSVFSGYNKMSLIMRMEIKFGEKYVIFIYLLGMEIIGNPT
jgi:hypothetical protein